MNVKNLLKRKKSSVVEVKIPKDFPEGLTVGEIAEKMKLDATGFQIQRIIEGSERVGTHEGDISIIEKGYSVNFKKNNAPQMILDMTVNEFLSLYGFIIDMGIITERKKQKVEKNSANEKETGSRKKQLPLNTQKLKECKDYTLTVVFRPKENMRS